MNHIQLKKILIAVEDSPYSDKATDYGFTLARQMKASIALVHVNDLPMAVPYVADPLLNEPPILMPGIMQAQEESSKKLLERISEKLGGGITLFTFNKIGNPKDEILATAEEWEADMIILGTHGRTGFDHFISGSVAESVVRKAKCPVLIIPVEKEETSD